MKTLIHYLNGAESCVEIYYDRNPEFLKELYENQGYKVIEVYEFDTLSIISL